jgi:hypothetical protein
MMPLVVAMVLGHLSYGSATLAELLDRFIQGLQSVMNAAT